MIHTSEYIGSYVREDKCPQDNKAEYAFIGRSNVGKSSLINMLCERKGLAKTSNTPGKTQTINYFLINKEWYLVDLPGYGYAKVSQTLRAEWQKMIHYFLKTRQPLQCVFVLIDAMVPAQKADIEFINMLGQNGVPYVIAYTKTDRLKQQEVTKNIKSFQDELLKFWNILPQQFITSAEKGTGRDEILGFIDGLNSEFEKNTTK